LESIFEDKIVKKVQLGDTCGRGRGNGRDEGEGI
jgi:hypothetical protein